jgi:hypothetical protein
MMPTTWFADTPVRRPARPAAISRHTPSATAHPSTHPLWKVPGCGKLRSTTRPDLSTTLGIPAPSHPTGIPSPPTAPTTTKHYPFEWISGTIARGPRRPLLLTVSPSRRSAPTTGRLPSESVAAFVGMRTTPGEAPRQPSRPPAEPQSRPTRDGPRPPTTEPARGLAPPARTSPSSDWPPVITASHSA